MQDLLSASQLLWHWAASFAPVVALICFFSNDWWCWTSFHVVIDYLLGERTAQVLCLVFEMLILFSLRSFSCSLSISPTANVRPTVGRCLLCCRCPSVSSFHSSLSLAAFACVVMLLFLFLVEPKDKTLGVMRTHLSDSSPDPGLSFWFFFLNAFFPFVGWTRSRYVALASRELCRPGWPGTHRDPPAFASQVLGLQMWATMPSFYWSYFFF